MPTTMDTGTAHAMLELNDIRFSITDQEILKGITAGFAPRRIHGIVGPNGSGKSSLLKNICRVWRPDSGTVRIHGRDARTFSRRELSRTVTLVPQDTSVEFPVTVLEMVSMGRNPHLGRFRSMRREDREIVARAVAQTGTRDLEDRSVTELSGGERQLVVIARALATEASLILLDEPTSDLDIHHSLTIMELLVSLKEQGKTMLVCMHDINLARRYCDTVTILLEGALFFTGQPQEAFSRENIRQVFRVDVQEIRSEARSFLYFSHDAPHDTTL